MRIKLSVLLTLTLCAFAACKNTPAKDAPATVSPEKTAFQNAAPWCEQIDIRSDVAIVYGIGDAATDDFEKKVEGYRSRGYGIHFMTGSAWGHPDYVRGDFDGKTHFEDSQVEKNGDTIWHGNPDPYMVPSPPYVEFLKSQTKRAIDAGAKAIHMEEPEFWARAGYSDSFKAEWQKYYGTPWVAQHESPEATYMSSKLKYHLYYNLLEEVFKYAKEYAASIGTSVQCYVPTHSLLNYSAWEIVSPEASLASIPYVDGYVAQVWTGTSRVKVYYNGVEGERVFENAFLEYGSMISMTAPTNRKIFLLTDPIEDGVRSWNDYKVNYHATFAAQLFYPMVNNYEVMPWPSRIYQGKYPVDGMAEPQLISKDYSTMMQVMINTLNDMPLTDNKINGTHGIGIMLCNSMMFQRFPTHNSYEDPRVSNFYGMALPLLKRGVPVETVHYENTGYPATLKDIKVLIMSYANMKPLEPAGHTNIAEWVKNGGVLVYSGRDNDPFQTVREWWNTDGNKYAAPADHLFSLMGISPKMTGNQTFEYGKGRIYVLRNDPKEYVLKGASDGQFVATVVEAYENAAQAGKVEFKNNLVLNRGAYTIAAVLTESVSADPLSIDGMFIDLYDPTLPILNGVSITPGTQRFLYSLDKSQNHVAPKVLCGASRVYDEVVDGKTYSFVAKSPIDTWNVQRILLSGEPKTIVVQDTNGKAMKFVSAWDAASSTLKLEYDNLPDGVAVAIEM